MKACNVIDMTFHILIINPSSYFNEQITCKKEFHINMETYPPSKRYDLKFKADIGGIEELTVPSNYSYCFQVFIVCLLYFIFLDDFSNFLLTFSSRPVA